jgi:hypothetical protein
MIYVFSFMGALLLSGGVGVAHVAARPGCRCCGWEAGAAGERFWVVAGTVVVVEVVAAIDGLYSCMVVPGGSW